MSIRPPFLHGYGHHMDTTIQVAIVPCFRQARVVPLQLVRGAMGESGILKTGFVETTMIYTHVLNSGCRAVRSPADTL